MDILAFYSNISIDNGSIIKLNIYKDDFDFIAYMDFDDDGIVDYEIEPSYILGPPEKPEKPIGTQNGKVGQEYSFSTSTIDSNDDDIYYQWNWGDGNFSDLLGPYNSGEISTGKHTWVEKGTYEVKVKAIDITDRCSDWPDPLSVTMPRNRATQRPFLQFLQNFLQQYPILYQLLQRFLRL